MCPYDIFSLTLTKPRTFKFTSPIKKFKKATMTHIPYLLRREGGFRVCDVIPPANFVVPSTEKKILESYTKEGGQTLQFCHNYLCRDNMEQKA